MFHCPGQYGTPHSTCLDSGRTFQMDRLRWSLSAPTAAGVESNQSAESMVVVIMTTVIGIFGVNRRAHPRMNAALELRSLTLPDMWAGGI